MNTITLQQLIAGTSQVLPEGELQKKLAQKEKLRIKLGMDPTSPDLHLGHAVVLSKMKLFQDAGHEILFLIGDFTARIGDPTGRSKTRPPLTEEDIAQNTKTYFEQVSRILDPQKITVHYNATWLDKLSSRDWIKLCGQVTVAQIIEREDFAQRLSKKQPVGFHELLYPLLQGYDSVALKADLELGGTDQTFNLLMGRHLQQHYDQDPQVIMTMPILEGLDGVQKMSKSLGNAIGLTEAPDQAYGKLMSISDDLMWRYYSLLLNMPEDEIKHIKEKIARNEAHPMDIKKDMAYRVVERFWSKEGAEQGKESFTQLFQKKDLSHAQTVILPSDTENPLWIVNLLKILNAVQTTSEARRLITAGAVKIDDEKITDFKAEIHWKPGIHIKVGKHKFYKLG